MLAFGQNARLALSQLQSNSTVKLISPEPTPPPYPTPRFSHCLIHFFVKPHCKKGLSEVLLKLSYSCPGGF